MAILFFTLALFAIAMLVMAVGVIMRRPCLRGSCGGPEVLTSDGEPLTCATCPNRKKRGTESAASLPVV
ncbi:MAG: Na(+)-translocating NADH-quinone reductase subunit E [Acidobacteriota bacterium]